MARRPDVRYINFYTDGSAAYQLEPARPQKKQHPQSNRKHAKRKCQTVYVDPIAIAGIFVAVVMLVLMLVGVARLNQAHQTTEMMAEQLEDLKEENLSLQAEYDSGCNIEDIKWKAEALGMVPVEQVKHVMLPAPETDLVEAPSAWERFCTYLTSLFA